MSARNEIFICLGCLAAASVGFLLVCTYTRFFAGGAVKPLQSVLATLVTRFTSASGQPIDKFRDAAVTASTPSSPNSLSSPDSLPDKAKTPPSKHRARREKLHVDVGEHPSPEREVHVEAKLSQSHGALSADATPTQHTVHTVHFLTPTQDVPVISISPPPTRTTMRMSTQSDSSASTSTDNRTRSSESSAASVDAPAPEGEAPRGRRSRFSKIVHLFSDKRGNSKPRRRESLPALRTAAESSSSSSAIPPVPPLPPHLLSSPPLPPPTAEPATSPILLSKPVKPKRRRSRAYIFSFCPFFLVAYHRIGIPVIIRTASCPILHHSHHGRSRSSNEPSEAVPPIPQSPFLQSPLTSPLTSPVQSPVRSKTKAEKKEKEPVARPRTQPYAAPYFILPPDSVDVEEPLARRRPSRRRTTPPERAASTSRVRS
ncbi:hypothetical protein DFH08DRAFT_363321 [Mycena albidolilacea]|uniref:Uncharacterized protein n=1 Tax=Mycena albidolilacea TaxID=1033008 RepID=A0AAD7AJZ4_9AGAR|nr:hypothetical protein DFH08DRAFT_363321 [Mycena albidolilacea]